MLCFLEKNVPISILATSLFFLFCKLVSIIYKTKYYYCFILVVYTYNVVYTPTLNYLGCMLNAIFLTWTLCLIHKIANSIFSNVFFTMVFVYVISITDN